MVLLLHRIAASLDLPQEVFAAWLMRLVFHDMSFASGFPKRRQPQLNRWIRA
jgi:hypothetical protein